MKKEHAHRTYNQPTNQPFIQFSTEIWGQCVQLLWVYKLGTNEFVYHTIEIHWVFAWKVFFLIPPCENAQRRDEHRNQFEQRKKSTHRQKVGDSTAKPIRTCTSCTDTQTHTHTRTERGDREREGILYNAFQYWKNDKLYINLNLLIFMLNVVILIWLTDTSALVFTSPTLFALPFCSHSFWPFHIIYCAKRSNWPLSWHLLRMLCARKFAGILIIFLQFVTEKRRVVRWARRGWTRG